MYISNSVQTFRNSETLSVWFAVQSSEIQEPCCVHAKNTDLKPFMAFEYTQLQVISMSRFK